MAAPGIVSVKTFTYKDAPEEWSNKYHFQGSAPTTPAGWRALCDAFALKEKTVIDNSTTITKFICYDDTDHVAVYTYNLAAFGGVVTGTLTGGTAYAATIPGDSARLIRWNTGRTSTRGKPIYLFKYYHGGQHDTDQDKVQISIQLAAMNTFASTIGASSGSWPGLAGPDGVAPTGYYAEPFITTRTLRRRGRRPT